MLDISISNHEIKINGYDIVRQKSTRRGSCNLHTQYDKLFN